VGYTEYLRKFWKGGGDFCGQKMEIPGRRGSLHEIPSVVEV